MKKIKIGKIKNTHPAGTVPKSNIKIDDKGQIDTTNTHILMLQSNLAGLFELQTMTVDESTIYM